MNSVERSYAAPVAAVGWVNGVMLTVRVSEGPMGWGATAIYGRRIVTRQLGVYASRAEALREGEAYIGRKCNGGAAVVVGWELCAI